MSLYEKLAREAAESGRYTVPEQAQAPEPGSDGETLRSQIRSKMEWIAAREEFRALNGPRPEVKPMKLAPFVKFREEKFGGVLFETRSEKVFTLTPSGAAIVMEIASGGGDKDVIERLKARFDDKDGSLEEEAVEFIACLKEKGLVAE